MRSSEFCNKTAKYYFKNCTLSIELMVINQKLQKSLENVIITQHHIDI